MRVHVFGFAVNYGFNLVKELIRKSEHVVLQELPQTHLEGPDHFVFEYQFVVKSVVQSYQLFNLSLESHRLLSQSFLHHQLCLEGYLELPLKLMDQDLRV
jgi:hypothetical protein